MTLPADCSTLPLVSVLVPCFNHARYIEACLDSLLADGYPNLELVLLDDGSTDASFEIAERWAAEKSSQLAGGARLSRQANAGVVKTLNTLLRSARGAHFALLASDDYLLPGGIMTRVRYLENQPQYLAVFGDAVGIDEDSEPVADSMLDHFRASRTALRCDRTRTLEIITRWVMPGPVYLARREVIDRIGFYNEDFCFEDRDYYLRLLAARALGYVDVAVAAYRVARVRDPNRYLKNARDREQIERQLMPQFKGLAWMALSARTQRLRLQASGQMQPLTRVWDKLLKQFLNRLRRINRLVARLLQSSA